MSKRKADSPMKEDIKEIIELFDEENRTQHDTIVIKNIIKKNIAEPYQCTRSKYCKTIHGCRSTALRVAFILSTILSNIKSEYYKHDNNLYMKIKKELIEVLSWGRCRQTDYIKNINYIKDRFIKPDNIYIIITSFEWLYGMNSPYHTFVISTKSDGNAKIWQSWYDGGDDYVELNQTEIQPNDLIECLKRSENKDSIQQFFTAPPNHVFKNISSAYIIDFTGLYKDICKSKCLAGKIEKQKSRRKSRRKFKRKSRRKFKRKSRRKKRRSKQSKKNTRNFHKK